MLIGGASRSTRLRNPAEGLPNSVTAATCGAALGGSGPQMPGGQRIARRDAVRGDVAGDRRALRVAAEHDLGGRAGVDGVHDLVGGISDTIGGLREIERGRVIHADKRRPIRPPRRTVSASANCCPTVPGPGGSRVPRAKMTSTSAHCPSAAALLIAGVADRRGIEHRDHRRPLQQFRHRLCAPCRWRYAIAGRVMHRAGLSFKARSLCAAYGVEDSTAAWTSASMPLVIFISVVALVKLSFL